MATMQMYCPSLKKNVKATITDGKRVASKGGSLRNIIYGEYEGRKCLPKTVKEEVFAQHGFGAESEGESATYEPSQEPEGSTPATEPTNASFSAEKGLVASPVNDWEGKGNNDGLVYGIVYRNYDTGEVADVEWFSTVFDRDAELDQYLKQFEANSEGRPHCDNCIEKGITRYKGVDSCSYCGKLLCEKCFGDEEVCVGCYPDYSLGAETESFCSSCGSHKRAEGCGCMAAESSPSSFDISWEDAQGVSSPSLPPEGIHFAEQGKNIKFCNGCNKRTNFEDGECNFCAFPEFGAEEDYHLNGETCEHCAEEVQLNAEGFCSECYEDLYLSETMAAEGISRNGKLVLGLTALGVGMAMALGSERVASLLDKLNRK